MSDAGYALAVRIGRLARLAIVLGIATSTTNAAADETAAPPPKAKASIAGELGASAGMTMLLAPVVYSAARLVGTSTANLSTSAVPALLIAAAVPPAIATAALMFERRREGAVARFFPTYLYALGAQLLVLTGAFYANTWVKDVPDLLLLSAASGAACGGAATLGAELSF
jgi:hypothetical protein